MTAWSVVALQLVLMAGLVWFPGERAWPVSGWLVAAAALMIAIAAVFAVAWGLRLGAGLTASPLPSAAAQLRTTGVYACVRHPIYTGPLLGGAARGRTPRV